jgi:hypothetical protein
MRSLAATTIVLACALGLLACPGGGVATNPGQPHAPATPIESADPEVEPVGPTQQVPPTNTTDTTDATDLTDPADTTNPTDPADVEHDADRPDGAPCTVADECAGGVCEGQGCGPDQGVCASRRRMCTKDRRSYCGCDGQTFYGSGSCPGQRFEHVGACN